MRYLSCLFFLFFCAACTAQTLNIIPQPLSVKPGTGVYPITPQTALIARDQPDQAAAAFFNEYLKAYYGFSLPVATQGKGIELVTRRFVQAPDKDGYDLTITTNGIRIEGDTYAGSFYGIQTLIQLLPAPAQEQRLSIPVATIRDEPRFAYRGMHLDVGRHLFPVAFIKRYIDYIALHKMNYFHWHLTEDQGWRIEIMKYPRLTEVGAWRNGTIIGRYPGKGNDNTRYGGYYTQEEVKEVVAYAAARHITVVPEIEMPGHALAALTSYPHLGCPGTGPYQVAQTWGVFEDVFCAGNDSTFAFLQDVLDEVTALFPSQYVHIGGDECPKDNWRSCPRCKARMQQEKLKDEHELQSYFIQRIERYLNAKGKTIIGWDEILEGGLAPNAVVMSWRGEAGGIAAAQQNHKVIMTPGSHCYFDHSQSQDEDSVTIGGFTSLQKVYGYEPVPAALTPAQGKMVLGAQANVWTEYMRYPSKVEYMIFPRISAMSEVLWSAKEKRNWNDFERRMNRQYQRYELWGTNYSNAHFELNSAILPAPGNEGLRVQLESRDKTGRILYGIAGQHLQKDYSGPVLVKEPADLTALLSRNGKILDSQTIRLRFNKATGRKVQLSEPPAANYPGDGAFTLVDGIINSRGMSRSKEFIGFNGKKVSATIDLGSVQPFSEVRLHALFSSGSWIYPPQLVTVLVSNDGKNYRRMGAAREFVGKDEVKGHLAVVVDEAVQARYVRVQADALEKISANMPGAGSKAWMFLDEIEVR